MRHALRLTPVHFLLALVLALFVAATLQAAQNPASITIRDYNSADGYQGTANPYPSVITVSGVTEPVTRVTVSLNAMYHDFPGDVDILLVGPQGQSVILMSDASDGGGAALQNIFLTFDDLAAQPLPYDGVIVSGTYKPTNHAPAFCSQDPERFPAPAPTGSYGAGLSVFKGTDPNGDWKLYVVDDCGGDSGVIGGGWSLDINPPLPPTPTPTPVPADTTPPTVTCSVNPTTIWSKNHTLMTVTASVNVQDAQSGPAGFSLVSVTSSEADSGLARDDVTNDIQGWLTGTPDVSGQLRAETYNRHAARVYTLTYRGLDGAGNSATCSATVTVKNSK